MPRFKIIDQRIMPISQLRVDEEMIRSVNKKRKDWPEFVASIKTNGVMQPVQAREVENEETGELEVVIIDGGHRFTAAQEAGVQEIPVAIVEATDEEVLDIQLTNNYQRFDTSPAEYSKQLQRILALHPHMTTEDLAKRLDVSSAFISNRLSLNRLNEGIKTLVNEGKIPLTNAYYLAKLPQDHQDSWKDRAQSMPFNKFAPECKQAADNLKKPKERRSNNYEPVAKSRKFSDIRSELNDAVSFLRQAEIDEASADPNSEQYRLGYIAALRFACHLDPDSIEEAREEFESRKAEQARKKAEREAKKDKPSDILLAAAADAQE